MSNLPEHAAQRASDADREAVIEVLQSAVADGRLDLAEFDERMARAYESKTFGELAPLTTDLQGVSGHFPVGPSALAGQAAQDLVLKSTGSSITRKGGWVVPRRVVVKNNMGSVVLDFTEAKVLTKVVEVELGVSMGSAVLIVPDGTHVNTDDVQFQFGSAKIKVPESGDPPFSLRVSGSMNMGSLVVRRLGWWGRWKLARANRRKAIAG